MQHTDEKEEAIPLSNTHKRELRGFQKYANSTVLSDVTIRYGNDGELTFKAHKVILSSKSSWFEAALTGGFEEANLSEIILQEDDLLMVTVMLQLAYNCIPRLPGKPGRTGNVIFGINLYEVADKYEFLGIMNQSRALFANQMSAWIHVCRRKGINGGNDTDRFKGFCDIIEAIHELPNARRNHPLVSALMDVLHERGATGEYSDELPILLDAVAKVAGFGRDMFVYLNSPAATRINQPLIRAPPQVSHISTISSSFRCNTCHVDRF